MAGQILIPKFGGRGRDGASAARAFRDPAMFKSYVDAEKHKYRRKAGSIFQRYKNYQANKKAELRLEGVIDARTYMRWQAVDPHFWDDDANVKKFLKDNRETTPWKS
tara:strand:+ start:44 stop:364 length:321 start_codon:yes stop_codon:yes gene_type:complete